VSVKKFRKKIVAGNWKMNKLLARAIKMELADFRDVDVVLCPPFTALKAVGDVVFDTSIKLGAQNMHWEPDGAYTGEISAAMLRDLYCRYVIVGHSERRGYFHETDRMVNQKAKAALGGNLCPIVCVGETLKQREAGETRTVLRAQVEQSLAGLGQDIQKVIVAYEPVWAIGTGQNATPEQAQEAHAFIRQVVGEMAGVETAASMRIQYGGSVKPANAKSLLSQPDVDGGLVGGASLEARTFVEIVQAAV
jgi:triosephosphate isomerase